MQSVVRSGPPNRLEVIDRGEVEVIDRRNAKEEAAYRDQQLAV